MTRHRKGNPALAQVILYIPKFLWVVVVVCGKFVLQWWRRRTATKVPYITKIQIPIIPCSANILLICNLELDWQRRPPTSYQELLLYLFFSKWLQSSSMDDYHLLEDSETFIKDNFSTQSEYPRPSNIRAQFTAVCQEGCEEFLWGGEEFLWGKTVVGEELGLMCV